MTTAVLRTSARERLGRSVMAASVQLCRTMHDTAAEERGAISPTDSYKLLVLGGGTAGSTVASKFATKLGKRNVAVIEPSKVSAK